MEGKRAKSSGSKLAKQEQRGPKIVQRTGIPLSNYVRKRLSKQKRKKLIKTQGGYGSLAMPVFHLLTLVEMKLPGHKIRVIPSQSQIV